MEAATLPEAAAEAAIEAVILAAMEEAGNDRCDGRGGYGDGDTGSYVGGGRGGDGGCGRGLQ
jgi:hypothetical protein